jgi:serine protease Do
MTSEAASLSNLAETVEKVMAGVVNIRTLDDSKDQKASIDENLARKDKFFDMFLLPQTLGASRENRSLGSGFFIQGKEFIVTNHHVVKDAQRIDIIIHGRRFPARAKFIGSDPRTDIAVLQVEKAEEAVNLVWGASELSRIGEPVFTIGNPFGYGHTVTSGILSARNRVIGQGPFDDFIQTDAAINPGNSGGPLFNKKGEVIGINTALLSDARGISFAIPSEVAKRVIAQLIQKKSVRRPWLGIVVPEKETLESAGVLIENVAKNSPALKAGLRKGDVILAMDEAPLFSKHDLTKGLQSSSLQRKRNLKIFRDGSTFQIQIKPSLMPENSDLQNLDSLY